MNNFKSMVCTIANKMVKEGYSRSDAFVTAWKIVKNSESYVAAHAPKEEAAADEELATQVMEYRELQSRIEELEEKASEIKKSIIKVMEERQEEELKVDVFKVRYITVVSNRFNVMDFKKSHTELYSQYLKESTCKRFTVV